jgi:hypothetical protein
MADAMNRVERPAQFGDALLLDARDAWIGTRFALSEVAMVVTPESLGVHPPPWMDRPRVYRLDGWLGLDRRENLEVLGRLNALLESERISYEVWEA